MHASFFLAASGLAAFAVALPKPLGDGIDVDGVQAKIAAAPVKGPPLAVAAVAAPPTFDSAAAAAVAAANPVTKAANKVKRQPQSTTSAAPTCTPLPAGKAPTTSPDTDTAFLQNPVYDKLADSAVVPDGYVKSFSDLNGATEGSGYLGYYTLDSYDTIRCQQYCDQADGCWGFNVFIERDPTVNPDSPNCQNPPSTAVFKCSLFGLQLTAKTATNVGQYRGQFHVVITASNGYSKVAPPPPEYGYTGPVELGGAIQAPDNSYLGYKYFQGPYAPSQCTAACSATTAYDQAHPRPDGTFDKCVFVNAYVLSKNGAPQGTYCSLYSKAWGRAYGTNVGQYRGNDYYSVSQSYGFSLSAQ